MVEKKRINQQAESEHPKTRDEPPNRRTRLKRWIRVRWRWTRFRKWPIARWVSLATLVIGGLIIASRYVSGDTDPIQFITGNLLNVLIFAAIVAQVLIYRKQRDVMRRQWRTMERQARSADQSVVFGLRAYVGIHSLDPIDTETKRICLRIENSGKVPAYDVNVKVLMEVRIPEQSIPDEQARNPPWKIGGGFTHMNWGYSHHYGRAKLFPRGNLPIAIPVALNSWLSRKQIDLIAEGPAEMRFKGNIEFNDGFHKGKNSSFAFRYSHESHQWIVDAVITKEEVETRIQKRIGGRDLSEDWHIIETYAPQVIVSSKETKKDEKINPESEDDGEKPN
jgi:hypothetical protein